MLASYEPSLVHSSDLSRAAETARALAAPAGLAVRLDERLREIHAGEWQGMTAGDVAEQFPEEQAALAAGEDLPRGVHGETLSQVAARVRAARRRPAGSSSAPGRRAVVATHGVAGRAVVASLVGLSQHEAGWPSAGCTTATGPSCARTTGAGGSSPGTPEPDVAAPRFGDPRG